MLGAWWSGVAKRVVKLAPWIVAVPLIAFLLYRHPLDEIRDQMVQGTFWPLIPLALASALLSLFSVAWADTLLFSSLGRASFRQVFRGKAATSVLMTLHYGLSHGGYAMWIARATGARPRQALGLVAYVMVSDLAALCLLGACAATFGGSALPDTDRWSIAFVGFSAFVGATVLAIVGPRLLPRLLSNHGLSEAWAKVPLRTYLASVAIRLINLGGSAFIAYFAARAFGLAIPLATFMAYLPVIYVIGALPLNIAGFGAVQVAWVGFFASDSVPGAQVLAFQFLFQAAMMGGLILRGLPFVRSVGDELRKGAPTAPEPLESGATPDIASQIPPPSATRAASCQQAEL